MLDSIVLDLVFMINWISVEKSVAEVRIKWRGRDTLIGAGWADALDRLVALELDR